MCKDRSKPGCACMDKEASVFHHARVTQPLAQPVQQVPIADGARGITPQRLSYLHGACRTDYGALRAMKSHASGIEWKSAKIEQPANDCFRIGQQRFVFEIEHPVGMLFQP